MTVNDSHITASKTFPTPPAEDLLLRSSSSSFVLAPLLVRKHSRTSRNGIASFRAIFFATWISIHSVSPGRSPSATTTILRWSALYWSRDIPRSLLSSMYGGDWGYEFLGFAIEGIAMNTSVNLSQFQSTSSRIRPMSTITTVEKCLLLPSVLGFCFATGFTHFFISSLLDQTHERKASEPTPNIFFSAPFSLCSF